jgi:hypothetical protein
MSRMGSAVFGHLRIRRDAPKIGLSFCHPADGAIAIPSYGFRLVTEHLLPAFISPRVASRTVFAQIGAYTMFSK